MNEQSYELMVNCAKGAVMGKNALNAMANYVSGEEAKGFLLKSAADHETIEKKINEAIEAENREPQAISGIAVWLAELGIKIKFFDKKSDGEIMTSVAASCDKALRSLDKYAAEYPDAEPEAKKWLEKLRFYSVRRRKRACNISVERRLHIDETAPLSERRGRLR